MKKNIFAGSVKGLDMDSLGGGRLGVEQAAAFIRDMLGRDVVLSPEHLVLMDKPELDIPRTIFNTRVLRGGSNIDNDAVGLGDGSLDSDLEIDSVRLAAVMYHGRVPVTNKVIQYNIEKDGFQNTILEMVTDQANDDVAEKLWHSDTAIATPGDVLKLQDGWLKLAAKATISEGLTGVALLQAVYAQFPTRYLKKIEGGKGVFYVTRTVFDKVVDDIAKRETNLGDAKLTAEGQVFVKGIEVKHSYALNHADIAQAVVLTPIENLKYGIYEDIKINTFVNYDVNKTFFYPEVHIAAGIQVPDATLAFIDKI